MAAAANGDFPWNSGIRLYEDMKLHEAVMAERETEINPDIALEPFEEALEEPLLPREQEGWWDRVCSALHVMTILPCVMVRWLISAPSED